MRGINLTIPHKVRVIPFLDELTELQRSWFKDNRKGLTF